jgi:hypothetical protein
VQDDTWWTDLFEASAKDFAQTQVSPCALFHHMERPNSGERIFVFSMGQKPDVSVTVSFEQAMIAVVRAARCEEKQEKMRQRRSRRSNPGPSLDPSDRW